MNSASAYSASFAFIKSVTRVDYLHGLSVVPLVIRYLLFDIADGLSRFCINLSASTDASQVLRRLRIPEILSVGGF
jgi:hypothetical protein